MAFKNLQQQNAAIEAAAREQAKRDTIAYVYEKFPTLIRCDSNGKMIVELVERWAGMEVHPSPVLFDSMLYENGNNALSMLAHQSEAKTREQLTEHILDLLAAKGKNHDEFSLKQERTRSKTFSLPMLRQRLEDLQRGAHFAGQSIQSLKAMVAEAHSDTRPYPGFPILPQSVWNGTTHIPLTATTFRSMDAWEIKKYSRIYSAEQVNARIAQG